VDLLISKWVNEFFFVCVCYWGLNSGPSPWATPPALFLWRVFWDRVLWTICPGWPRTVILLISASWVARITGMSHWHLAYECIFLNLKFYLIMINVDPYNLHKWLSEKKQYRPKRLRTAIVSGGFFCDTGVWTQGLEPLEPWATPPALFCDGFFSR
jgi:hypothetical protein